MKFKGSVLSAMLLLMGGAHAESMLEPLKSFDGVFLGFSGGFTNLMSTDQQTRIKVDTGIAIENQRKTIKKSDTASIFGVELGYGRGELRDAFYLGIKGFLHYSPYQHDHDTSNAGSVTVGGVTTTTEINTNIYTQLQPIYGLDVEIGHIWQDDLLSYVVAGINFNTLKYRYTTQSKETVGTAAPDVQSAESPVSDIKVGGNIGLGMKYLATDHIMLTGEYVYTYLGKVSKNYVLNGLASGNTENYYHTRKLSMLSAMGGITFLFSSC